MGHFRKASCWVCFIPADVPRLQGKLLQRRVRRLRAPAAASERLRQGKQLTEGMPFVTHHGTCVYIMSTDGCRLQVHSSDLTVVL